MLKTLKLQKQRDLAKEKLKAKKAEREKLQKRSTEMEELLEAAATEEELQEVTEQVEELEVELTETEEIILELEVKIEELEEQIEEAIGKTEPEEMRRRGRNRSGGSGRSQRPAPTPVQTREFAYPVRNEFERRERMSQALRHPEVRSFFENVINLARMRNVRGVSSTDLLIPEIVVDMISIDMLDVGKIQALVHRQSLGGTGRIVMAGDTPAAIWTEMCAPLQELSLDFSAIELDGYKVSGFIPVCNATLEDAFINLATHVQEQISTAIAKAVDAAIINGTGSAGKQPSGIIPLLPATNKVTSDGSFADVIRKYALLPDDATDLAAVMTRATYYTWFASQTLVNTADGRVVVQSAQNEQRLPDGTPVVFVPSEVIPNNQMLLGDYSWYFLAQRAEMQLAVSTDVRFIEDQTVFKGTARYDGRPVKEEYWLLYTLEETEETP